MVNFKDNFESVINKWKKILPSMMGANHHLENHSCKYNGIESTIVVQQNHLWND